MPDGRVGLEKLPASGRGILTQTQYYIPEVYAPWLSPLETTWPSFQAFPNPFPFFAFNT